MYKILIAAGGTGGHLFPAQELIEKLQTKEKIEVLFGGHGLAGNPFFKKEAFPFQEIASPSLQKNLWKFCLGTLKGFFQSVRLILSFKPDVVIGFGSYHTFTLLLASVLLRRKLILFEANCMLGKVNRLFAPFASKLALQFPLQEKTRRKNQMYIASFPWKEKPKVSRNEAASHYGLDPNHLIVLVFGGSQGASFLNQAMPKAIDLMDPSIQVIHFTGKSNAEYSQLHVKKPFESEMQFAYAAADVVVCRSGAATIGELIEYQKKALLIPFAHAAGNHQWVNAQFLMQKQKGVRVLLEKEATPKRIAEELNVLLKMPMQRETIEKNHLTLQDLVLQEMSG